MDPKTKDTNIFIDKISASKNKTLDLQKNNTLAVEQNKTMVEHGHSKTNWKPKTRQISTNVPIAPASTLMDDMNAEQSYYPTPLMVYPFPMMNTYYPRYFPYTYPGYQGYPFFG